MVSERGMVTAAAMKSLELTTGPEFPCTAECGFFCTVGLSLLCRTCAIFASSLLCLSFPPKEGENEEISFRRSPD